jgi:hypothetical protein
VSNPVEERYQRLWPAMAPLSPRKQLLVAVAFTRRFAPLFTVETCHDLLAVAERVADDELELRALVVRKNECFKRLHENPAELPNRSADYMACELGFYATYRAGELLGRPRREGQPPPAGALLSNMLMWHPYVRLARPDPGDDWFELEERSFRAICQDIAGVPGARLDPRWVSDDVARLATVVYDSCDFSRLPELADALEDAGCADADLLAHCRGRGPHVRGCWAVDLVFGKQ